MLASQHLDPALHPEEPAVDETPRPEADPRPDPVDEAARAIVADALDRPADHNRAWRIPGGGE